MINQLIKHEIHWWIGESVLVLTIIHLLLFQIRNNLVFGDLLGWFPDIRYSNWKRVFKNFMQLFLFEFTLNISFDIVKFFFSSLTISLSSTTIVKVLEYFERLSDVIFDSKSFDANVCIQLKSIKFDFIQIWHFISKTHLPLN